MTRIMMGVYDAPSSVAPFLLALILIVSGVAKLLNLSTAADAFVSLRLPSILLKWRAPQMLPFAELVLALGLLVTSGPLQVVVALFALVLFFAYLGVIVRALTFNERVTCSCFGKLGLGAVDRFTAIRNGILVGLSVVTLADACHGRSVVARWAEFSGAEWLWLIGIVTAIALTWLISGHRGPVASVPTESPAADEEDYLRTPIPFGRIRRPDNSSVTLRALARTEPVLLLYVSPTCGSCIPVITKAREWQHQTDIVRTYLVLPMPPATEVLGLSDADDFNLLFDPESEIYNLFETGTPTAVLLGADGRLAGGPVVGSAAVAELMDDILVELSGGSETAAEVSTPETPQPIRPEDAPASPSPLTPGTADAQGSTPATMSDEENDDLAYLRRPTPYGLLHSRDSAPVPVISLADHAPTILLFVSPTCGSCRSVIEATPAWREALGDIVVAFVVHDESAALAIENIIGSPAGTVFFDSAGHMRTTFQIGNPGMVALGPDRLLLAGPVLGSADIAEAMDDIIEQVAALATPETRAGAQSDQPALLPESSTQPSDVHPSGRPFAPSSPLTRRDGSTVTMSAHGQDRQQLLAFISPGCEPCEALADKIPTWRAALPALDVVVVAYGAPEEGDVEPVSSFDNVLFDVEGDFGSSLNIMTPALMLVGKDGSIAGGPVSGLVECVDFVESIKAMYAEQI